MTSPRSSDTPERESVWDYPRPPRLESSDRHIKIVCGDKVIVETNRALRVLETSHPPVYYIRKEDILPGILVPTDRKSICEWKGTARYVHLLIDEYSVENAAWTYPNPVPAFAGLRNHFAFYVQLMDACYLNGERVQSQPGGFYGGWITSEVEGPFKGSPGTAGW